MSVQITDRRALPEADQIPGKLAFKSGETGSMLAVDDAEGVITAVVSVTGVEDEVADVIEPGAYKSTLMRRRPKVCWAHSWERPIGRVLHIEELMPGDERLPTKTRDGSPWPTEAGALVATMQFNMKSSAGQEAFEAARFFSESGECEWSIGYQVPPGKSTRDKLGVRHIKALELYELSVVLFGAHTMTGTIDIKTAATMARERTRLGGLSGVLNGRYTGNVDRDPSAKAALARILAADKAHRESKAIETIDGDDVDQAPDFSDGVMVAVYPDPEAADKVAAHIAGPDTTTERGDLHVTLAYLGTTAEVTRSADDIIRTVTEAVEGQPTLEGQIGGIGQFPDTGDGAPTWAPVDVPGLGLLREQIVEALGEDVRTDHGFTPHMTLGYDIGLIEPVPETPVTFSTVRVVYGNQQRDITLGSTVPAEEKTMLTEDSLASMSLDEVVRLTATESLLQAKAGGADRNRGNAEQLRKYWTTGEGGAKIRWGTDGDFTRCVRALREHMGERAKGYCANRHKEMNGYWPGDDRNKSAAYDPALDASGVETERKNGVHLPGSYEERQSDLRAAIEEALRGELLDEAENRYEWPYVDVRATFEDRVIATRMKFGPGEEQETWEMPYRFTEHGVDLGAPEPVELQLVAVDGGESVPIGDGLPLAENVMSLAALVKDAHRASIETKAGLVLSGAKERQLRTALETLLSVLASAGIEVDPRPEDDPRRATPDSGPDADYRREVDPNVDLTTTSPSASLNSKSDTVVLDKATLDADLARILND